MRRRYFIFRKRSTITLLILVLVCANTGFTDFRHIPKAGKHEPEKSCEIKGLYEELCLSEFGLKSEIFEKALTGLIKLKELGQVSRPELLSIADLSQSSTKKRLYIIDLARKMVLFNTYVSHGRNSGEEFASSFANKTGSFKSSLGFYLTGDEYKGAHGTSLRLNGLEEGINHKALERGIVVHGAEYVSESFIQRTGRLGRSQGCPAVPEHQCKPIVDCIKGGSCYYIYYPDSTYFSKSAFCD
jgi:hypothetical protein